jgi:hypothetical protein
MERTMENLTLATKLLNLNTTLESAKNQLADIQKDVAQLSNIATLLGGVGGNVLPLPGKRKRRTAAEIEADKLEKVA